MLPRAILRLPLLRPSSISQPIRASSKALPSSAVARYSTAAQEHEHKEDAHHASDHGSHYDPPGGWLWGIRPGEKYEKEGWENLFYFGFIGSWIVAIAAYTMKEDTSIQTWALEEARRRLEKEGILEDTNK